jgi:DNA-binding GntR family transcriptional regulator
MVVLAGGVCYDGAMTAADAVREQLEQDIITGDLQPGERLDEVALTGRFGVSRTPIREALRRLGMSGLVEIRPRRGAFVHQVSLAEMIEMFEVMAELEGMCGRLAARRIMPEQQLRLEAALDACVEAASGGDTDAYYQANADFHACLYESSQNGFLAAQAHALHTRLAPYRRLQPRVVHRMHESLTEHREVVEAILRGDPAAAEAALESHVGIQGEKFSDLASQWQT